MKNFEANLEPMSFLIKLLGPTEAWRSAKSFSRVVNSFVNSYTKTGSADEKRFERLIGAGSKLNENLEIYARTINFRFEWFSVMLVTFLDAYLEDLKIEAKRKIAGRKLSGRGPDIWVKRLKELGAPYSYETIFRVQHLRATRNLIIHSQGVPNRDYGKEYPNQSVMKSGRVRITSGQLKAWMEAVRDFVKLTDIFFLRYRSPESMRTQTAKTPNS
jgi:hypothetical protein